MKRPTKTQRQWLWFGGLWLGGLAVVYLLAAVIRLMMDL